MADKKNRVVITGLGVLSAVGSGVEGFWRGLKAEKSGVGPLTRFDASQFGSRVAAQVDDFDAANWMDARMAKRLDRFAQFSVAGARMALQDAGLNPASVDTERAGIYMGSALGGIAFAEEQHRRYMEKGAKAVSPTLAIAVFGGASSCNLAIQLGWQGPNVANANSCASGAIAVGEAADLIARGETDVMLAGGVETPLSPLAFGSFSLIRAMSTRNEDPTTASRPFDRDRDGFVMAEGCGVLVLESETHAQRRGADIYARVEGYATSNDAYSMTAPREDAAQSSRAMHLAIGRAGMSPDDIDYVNAHGSSTPLNDRYESKAIDKVFAGRPVPVSATKSFHGHALGASGAMELAACCLAMRNGWIPPSINIQTKDPDCSVAVVENRGREATLRRVLSNSFGFGGLNACVVLAKG